MLAYAARDAEMTLALHEWLTLYYPWATALHDVPANEPPLDVAEWIRPLLEAGRPQRADLAVAEIQRAPDPMELVADLRAGLAAVKRPGQRARLLRAIADLDLRALAPDIRPLIAGPGGRARRRRTRARPPARPRVRTSRPRPVHRSGLRRQAGVQTCACLYERRARGAEYRASEHRAAWPARGARDVDLGGSRHPGTRGRLATGLACALSRPFP